MTNITAKHTIVDMPEEIGKRYPTLFTDICKLPGKHNVTVDKTVTHVMLAPRKVPIALR